MRVLLVMSEGSQGGVSIGESLRLYGDFEPLSRNCYALRTALPPEELSASLRTHLTTRVYVVPVRKDYTGWAPPIVRQWLDEQSDAGPST
jgi:hypothetical protein